MKIAFTAIKQSPIPFNVRIDEGVFKGVLTKKKRDLISLEANFEAKFNRICDRCGRESLYEHTEDLNLYVSDGIYSSDTDELEDIIECFESFIDLNEIAQGELDLIKHDYYYCKLCQEG